MSHSKHDGNPPQEDCRFVGGLYDGWTIQLARSQMEFALPAEAAPLLGSLEEMAGDIARLAGSLDTMRTENDLLDALDGNPDDEDYAEPAPGGVLYRRGNDGRTFHFVGYISVEELEARQEND